MTAPISPYKIASVLLQYPDHAVFATLDDVDSALTVLAADTTRDGLSRLARWLRATPPTEAAAHHVATFDLRRRCSPYLTYYRYGDTQQRGMALLALKHTYRSAGFEPCEDELPDYLPLVLEFAALSDRGRALLRTYRAGLELLRHALVDAGSPYMHGVAAVGATLPALRRRDLETVRRVATEGPPSEQVGLEPFAPPDYLSGARP